MSENVDIAKLMNSLGITTKEEVKSTCSHCKKKFTWVKQGKGEIAKRVFCSDECQHDYKKARSTWKPKKEEVRLQNITSPTGPAVDCWFLTKKLHPNAESAWAFIDMYHADDPKIEAYHCGGCGGIHIGHPKPGDKSIARDTTARDTKG